jgi:hypothetical protein
LEPEGSVRKVEEEVVEVDMVGRRVEGDGVWVWNGREIWLNVVFVNLGVALNITQHNSGTCVLVVFVCENVSVFFVHHHHTDSSESVVAMLGSRHWSESGDYCGHHVIIIIMVSCGP